MKWSDNEIEVIISWINSNYFDGKNFGSVSKTDYETFLFSVFWKHLKNSEEPDTDYHIGNVLGLTNSRVRSLKERSQLKYPDSSYDWKVEFAKYARNIHYDDLTKLVKINIPDVNVIKDLRYFLDINGWYDEYSLNPKLFSCKLELFLELCLKLEQITENNVTKQSIERMKLLAKNAGCEKERNAIEKIISGNYTEGLKELGVVAVKTALEVAFNFIPLGNVTKDIISSFIKNLKET